MKYVVLGYLTVKLTKQSMRGLNYVCAYISDTICYAYNYITNMSS